MKIKYILIILITFLGIKTINGQGQPNETIKKLVENLKKDPKGPYQQILWFCADGSTVLPQQRCPQPGGVQRAKYKDEIVKLGKTNHIYLGQILATTPFEDFWDADHQHSRLKQYLLEKYLQSVDNGWILRRARYYRGATQTEDENDWGINFFNWLLKDDAIINSNFFLVREAVRGIPHQFETKGLQNIRSMSLSIAESDPEFMDIRVKIHGQPDFTDIDRVKSFLKRKDGQFSPELKQQIAQLIKEMEVFYQPVQLSKLAIYLTKVPSSSVLKKEINTFIKEESTKKSEEKIKAYSEMLISIREKLNGEDPSNRLLFLDVSISLEEILFNELTRWEPETVRQAISLNYQLANAAVGCGYIEQWEWQTIKNILTIPANGELMLDTISRLHDEARSIIEWGTGMQRAVFADVTRLFGEFEPLAYHFIDDRVRSSILLPFGTSVSQLGNFIYSRSNLSNKVMDIENQSHFRGLNPGFAKGELVVVEGNVENIEVSRNKIYLFSKPPSDLKPVAGIATISEGNVVSHVQLLARNLGIPNAVLSAKNLNDMRKYSGTEVFYAVSLKGKVIIKPVQEMTVEEKKLFEAKKRSDEKITISVEKNKLEQTKLVNLRNVNSANSGELCGPKAANLGQLKKLFPEHVVDGLVIPFGIFRHHMGQNMPGNTTSYWQFLNSIFQEANAKQQSGATKTEIDDFVLSELAILREAIQKMPLLPEFIEDLKQQFISVLEKPLGTIPVFLRSDTNMEDLKDFTGAGLNLTLFNVLDEGKIIQGIKDVWASPYSERSYKWRQSYLLNPENVYPSILIIPSVDVDYSGVLITKGLQSGNDDELTIAFSRGAGGAVDGQAAETYLLKPNGDNLLISPAREPQYTILPKEGGTKKMGTSFENPILSEMNQQAIRDFAGSLIQKLKNTTGVNSEGPWDVELGFKDNKLWLFQVRPFVENRQAAASTYLQSISEGGNMDQMIDLNTRLE